MAREGQRRWTAAERRELWTRWKSGETIAVIARALGRKRGPVHRLVSEAGGFAPVPRKRNSHWLTVAEREDITREIACGSSIRSIATQLGRSPSTISREVLRNGGREAYRAQDAEKRALAKALRPKVCKLQQSKRLRHAIAIKLKRRWSPEQISGWLCAEYPEEPSMQISHEAIYQSLYIQARGVLKRELMAHLRTRRTTRRARNHTIKGGGRGPIADPISISERPPEADDRAVPGHWEGDLIAGSNGSVVATLVERQSRFVMLLKLPNKKAESLRKALVRRIRKLPESLKRSLTWDRGSEMAQHKEFAVATDVAVYFCDPYSPWQRGSNENTNGLLRQYLPKGTDLSLHSQAHLNKVALSLNQRPRKTLAFKTPADKLVLLLQ